jgi:hypothetical protein
MSKILVIGSSHAAALRRALPAITAEFPQHEVTCWTLTARCFNAAVVGPDGVLTPDPSRPGVRKQALRWNGAESVDLKPFDHILMAGLDQGIDRILNVAARLQPVEWGPRAGARAVSLDFLTAALRSIIAATLAAQSIRIPFDPRFSATPVPYATQASFAPALGHAPDAADVSALPRTADLFALYEHELRAAHLAVGLSFVPQPRVSLARPWVTQDIYVDPASADCLHMNADYGLLAFRDFAASLPALEHSARPLGRAATH